MRILTIETSCDESAISLTETNEKEFDGKQFKKISILGDSLNSQAALHSEFGGVYPTLAKREHRKNLVPLLIYTLTQGGYISKASVPSVSKEKLDKIKQILEREEELFAKLLLFFAQYNAPQIDAIAVVSGPGLAPALWVGVNFARALAFAWNKPIIKVNHMEGHIYSSFFPEDLQISPELEVELKSVEFPALALLLSGGHTELVEIKEPFSYKKLGQTLDDAVGEAYDKVARLLELGYPGGPLISKMADEFEKSGKESSGQVKLPRPKIHDDDLNFSFSGLKTAVLYLTEKLKEKGKLERYKTEIAFEFELAVKDVVLHKLQKAFDARRYKQILFGGGVSANRRLRDELKVFAKKSDAELLLPPMKLTGDNSLMSALVAHSKVQILKEKSLTDQKDLQAESAWELGE